MHHFIAPGAGMPRLAPAGDYAMQVCVHELPHLIEPSALRGSVVVVVDQLRASSTICQALVSGAKCVAPFVEIEETLARAGRYSREEIVFGGERHGQKISGFDLGNSPTEYTPEAVSGKIVLFSTTNGAKALAHARQAQRVLVGATVNRAAIVATLAGAARVDILCAGTDGQVTREDVLAAGAMVDGLVARTREFELNSSAEYARLEWLDVLSSARLRATSVSEQFARELRDTTGGKNLLAIGHEFDLTNCARLDALDVVPELDLALGVITVRPT